MEYAPRVEFNVVPFVLMALPALTVMGAEIVGIPGRMRRRREVSTLEPVGLGTLRGDPTPVLVGGAVTAPQTVTDPLSGDEVAAWRLTVDYVEVRVFLSGGERETERRTITLLSESGGHPFDLVDATGSAQVAGALSNPQWGIKPTILKDQAPSTLPAAVLARFTVQPPKGQRVTVRAQTIAQGATLHLLGRAVAAGSAPEGSHYRAPATAWAFRDHDDAPMVLSDGGAEGVRDELRRQIRGDSWPKVAASTIFAALGLTMTFGRFPGTSD